MLSIVEQTKPVTLRCSWAPKSTGSKEDLDTPSRASLGHSTNQSMVQQLTRDGNMRQRDLKADPTGDIHSTMWRLFLVGERKVGGGGGGGGATLFQELVRKRVLNHKSSKTILPNYYLNEMVLSFTPYIGWGEESLVCLSTRPPKMKKKIHSMKN